MGGLLILGHLVPAPDRPGLLLLFLIASATLSLYRPWEPSPDPEERRGLGLGTVPLSLVLVVLGPAAAGWIALLAHPSRSALRFLLRRPTRWSPLPEIAARDALALGAAWLVSLPGSAATTPGWHLAAGFAYLVVRGGVETGLARWRGLDPDPRILALRDLLPDGLSWALGTLLLGWASASAGEAGLPVLLAASSLLAFEASRQLARRRQVEASRASLLELGVAGTRLARVQPGMEEVAQRVFLESRRLIPAPWIELSLDRPTLDGERIWHLGPKGPLAPEAADPPDHPPPRPGIHRRVRWRLIERRLESGDEVLGRLRLWCDPRDPTRDQVALFDSLLPQLASLVHRARLDEEASRDPLTGAVLRRVLDEALIDAFTRSRSHGGDVSVVQVDLDFFKRINDRWGHGAGDEALRTVAAVLAGNLRDRDLCARYGGEEFTLLLEGLDGEAALAVAERLRSEVEELRIDHGGEEIPVTLSAGVASFPEIQVRSGSELLELADAALYEAKRLGRNCCLRHTGRGRFVDPRNRIIETGDDEPPEPRAPRIFA